MSKSKGGDGEAQPRYVPPGMCTWCSHKPHTGPCASKIRTAKNQHVACPCSRRR